MDQAAIDATPDRRHQDDRRSEPRPLSEIRREIEREEAWRFIESRANAHRFAAVVEAHEALQA